MAIEIKSRYDGRVLYAAKDARDVRAAVQEAVERGANLRGANLRGAEGFKPELTDDLRIGIPGVPIDEIEAAAKVRERVVYCSRLTERTA